MKIFIGSTRESKAAVTALMRQLHAHLGSSAVIQPWFTQFNNGQYIIPSIGKLMNEASFAIIILSMDDKTISRGGEFISPRDNLIFEAGFCTSALGQERVMLLVPTSSNRFSLPSDLSGIVHISFNQTKENLHEHSAQELDIIFSDVATQIVSTVSRMGPKLTIDMPKDNTIPIYHHISDQTREWFFNFRNSIEDRGNTFAPYILYSGPGLAQFWFKIQKSSAYVDKTATFNREIRSAIKAAVSTIHDDSVTLVDLGAGNMQPGSQALRELRDLTGLENRAINYVGIDISAEMLVAASHHADAIRLHKNGTSYCVQADFYRMEAIRKYIPNRGRRIFLLLGNTLGNEPDPIHLLSEIRAVMNMTDRLIVELQLVSQCLSNGPINDPNGIEFYFGPFLCSGYKKDDMICHIETKYFENGCQSSVFSVETKTIGEVSHPAFSSPVTIPAGKYKVLNVTKYTIAAIKEIFKAANLEIDYVNPSDDQPESEERRFAYIVARAIAV